MAPVVPFLPMIGQGIGTALGLWGAKKAKKENQAAVDPARQMEYMKMMGFDPTSVQGQYMPLAELMTGAGRQFMGDYSTLMSGQSPLFQEPKSFYQGLMTGDTATRRNLLAGTMYDIDTAGRGAMGQLERGVSDRALMGVQKGRLMRDIFAQKAKASTGLEERGAAGLTNIGQLQGQIGVNVGQLGLQGFNQAGDTLANMYRTLIGGTQTAQDQSRLVQGGQKQSWDQKSQLGGGVYDLLRQTGSGTISDVLKNLGRKPSTLPISQTTGLSGLSRWQDWMGQYPK